MLSASFALAFGCGGQGCAGCQTQPLPAGGLPGDQTIEGGAQVRLTPAGFDKVASIVPGLVNDLLEGGVCIPEFNDPVHACYERTCAGNAVGCNANISVNSLDTSIPNNKTLRVSGSFNAHLPQVDVDTPGPGTCTFDVKATNVDISVDIEVNVATASGKLTLKLADIPDVNIGSDDLEIDGDNILCEGAAEVVEGAAQTFEDQIAGFLEDPLNNALQGLLPDPLGIEGVVDLGPVLSMISPSTSAKLELRLLPGGYVALENNGMSLGVITGINADVDPSTRSAALDSEPALCVPPHAAPDLAAPPHSLAKNGRGNLVLPRAPEFSGTPDPSTDLIAGVSETGLDLAGHHLVTSGALCLEVGTELVPQLTLDTIGIVVPSLTELGSGRGSDPLKVVTRPQKPIDFSIGDGTDTSPSITLHVVDLEIDIYAWLFERYTRGFTASLDLDVGINLELMTDADGNTQILPVLVGLDAENVGVKVLNSEFLAEDAATIESVLPSLLAVVLPLAGNAIGPISLPEFAGFKIDNLSVHKVSTDNDDFLAIQGSLSPGAGVRALAARFPSVQKHLATMQRQAPAARAETRASLLHVVTPPATAVVAALAGKGGTLPEVAIDVATTDAGGRPLEHTYRINGGLWRPFSSASPLIIRDRQFVLQGKYTIEVRSRVVGDYRTLDLSSVVIPTFIDNVPPKLAKPGTKVEGKNLKVMATDLVSASGDIAIAFGHPGAQSPQTAWSDGTIAFDKARNLAGSSGSLGVWAKDEAGNVAALTIDISRLTAPPAEKSGGCSTTPASGSTTGAGFLALLVLAALMAFAPRRRRLSIARALRRFGPAAVFFVALAFGPACSCGGGVSTPNDNDDIDGGLDDDPVCDVDEDCDYFCGDQLPTCFEHACLCDDDLKFGDVGPHTTLAIDASGDAWVASYNKTYGDLMIAHHPGAGRIPQEEWLFVDGVPDGPVVKKGSTIRHGIADPGDDVGAYADIAVTADGTVFVSYFDRTHGDLKLLYGTPDAWEIITVDAGAADDGAGNYEIAGQYTQLLIKTDGRPAIAYMAEVGTAAGITSELRYTVAQTATPTGPDQWNTLVADSAALAPVSDDAVNIPPIARGVGLFADMTQLSDGSPAIAYYDRANGDLKLAVFDATAQSFGTPVVLAGSSTDAGWYPAVTADADDVLSVSYVDASSTDLLFVENGGSPT
ncbi:MAG TPA: MYXO-CTERM sorting domain-containing protein, partial [Kofleriaceae bacterium]|nr:MYXO-CTERM sorting domain-containing protein [Kofleriaceae bacterium]